MDNFSDFNESIYLREYERKLHQQSHTLYAIYSNAEIPILSIGVVGHLLNLVTLYRSRDMQTPSFLYHKTLALTELIYCVNCIAQIVVNLLCKVASETYSTAGATVYSSLISRMISSITGYQILYMTLCIASDRYFAINCHHIYRRWNNTKTALCVISMTLIISSAVHSWSSAIEFTFKSVHLSLENATTIAYRMSPRSSPPLYMKLRNVKNVYNSVVRIAYPAVLLCLTLAVVRGFLSQRKKRRKMSKVNRRARSRETNLFYLLILICVLAFIQVIPTEGRRILEFLHPFNEYKRAMMNETLSLEQKIYVRNIFYYGHSWGKLLANMCTFINRSISFYLYFCFNNAFRDAVVKVLRRKSSRRGSETSVYGTLADV